jgi:integrase
MATIKPCVQKQRADGYYPVYLRVTHSRKVGYIKTDKVVSAREITKNKDIKDAFVLNYCTNLIVDFNKRLNNVDISNWTLKEVMDFFTSTENDVSFSDYANKHIDKMIITGHARTSVNYRMAVGSLERFMGSNRLLFSQLTSSALNLWIESLSKTARAKEMYPTCIRQIFKAALIELNDEERDIVKIKFNPWLKIKIPKSDKTEQIAISAEACREFFNRPLPKTKMISSLPELGRDVAMLILCLGGINTVDLYNLKKENYNKGIISYKRAKTRGSRTDEAYMEMRVEPFIKPVFNKYLSETKDEYLFNFHTRYCDSDSFCANVNNGIKKICKDMGMAKEDYYCAYTFRHTWGTIAQNDCGANIYEVAFGLNHSHGFKVTRGYIKIDYSPAWRLNKRIIDFIFFSNEPSKQGKARDLEASTEKYFRISKKMMINGKAYFKGEVLAEVTDIGFSTVDDVMAVLIQKLPTTIPDRSTVQFRLTNCDDQREIVYEKCKGKGF